MHSQNTHTVFTQAASGKSLEYFDEENKNKFLPHVIEPSVGVDRLFLALMTVRTREEKIGKEERLVSSFSSCTV